MVPFATHCIPSLLSWQAFFFGVIVIPLLTFCFPFSSLFISFLLQWLLWVENFFSQSLLWTKTKHYSPPCLFCFCCNCCCEWKTFVAIVVVNGNEALLKLLVITLSRFFLYHQCQVFCCIIVFLVVIIMVVI